MKKTKRITALLSCLKMTKSFADIGCDHGFLTYFALEDGLIERGVLSDISEKSLNKARLLFSDKFSDRVTFNIGDGFCGLSQEIEQVAICGMGGMEIVTILNNAEFLPKYLLLSPQKNARLVRELVLKKGYGIDNDFLIEDDGKFYPIISCVLGLKCPTYSVNELEFGRDSLLNKGDFSIYINRQIDKLSSYGDSDEKEKKLQQFKVLKDELERTI